MSIMIRPARGSAPSEMQGGGTGGRGEVRDRGIGEGREGKGIGEQERRGKRWKGDREEEIIVKKDRGKRAPT